MRMIEVIEEIAMSLALCNETLCERCRCYDVCCQVFGKEHIATEITELAQQCKAFNKFVRANREE